MENNKNTSNQFYNFDDEKISKQEINKRECTSPTSTVKIKNDKHVDKIECLFKFIPQLKDIFTIHGQVGEGTFSSVLVASLKNKSMKNGDKKDLFAIKHLIPTCHPSRIERELKCMQDIGGKDNVVQILFCLRSLNSVAFVMPYVQHKSFSEYVRSMDVSETKLYIRNLLIALRRVHSFGIIHRDVKPSNFLYDRESKKFVLVDFGLAQDVSYQNVEKSKRKREENNEQENNESVWQLPKRMALQSNVFNTKLNSVHCSDKKEAEKNNKQNKTPVDLGKQHFKSNELNISPFKTNSSNIKYQSMFSGNNSITYIPSLTVKSVAKKLFPETGKENSCSIYETNQTIENKKHKMKIDSQEKNVLFVQQKENTYIQSMSKKLQNNTLAKNRSNNIKCNCFAKAKVCSICMLKTGQQAPRAGTPGFRPPEVLLKYPFQTTAIDVWAVGVILLSILSGCYPFFHSPDDMTALAELMTLFGTNEMKRIAKVLGQYLITSEKRYPIDLQQLCLTLRHKKEILNSSSSQNSDNCNSKNVNLNLHAMNTIEDKNYFPHSAFDLLKKLLDLNPKNRISAEEALKHPFLETK